LGTNQTKKKQSKKQQNEKASYVSL